MKHCTDPDCSEQNPQPLSRFDKGRGKCKTCRARYVRGRRHPIPDSFPTVDVELTDPEEAAARLRRLASDHAPLKPGDLGAAEFTSDYAAEKRQEFNEAMGSFATAAKGMTSEQLSEFVSLLAEQERRFMGRRISRSFALGSARDALFARQFEQLAARVVWPADPQGYARRGRAAPSRRLVTLVLSDLHVGAKLPAYENPEAFDFGPAGRRLAHLAVQCAEFKPQYRDVTGLNLAVNGDVIEGMLEHNDADNAPLAEQMVAAGQFLFAMVRYLASHFPAVDVWCEPGNHGRNKLSHPGRATSSKWNGYETVLYKFVEAQSAPLENVRFHVPKAPALVIPLFDRNALMTHGDTEVKLKAPSASGGKASWQAEFARINAERTYRAEIDLLIAGHFHDPEVMYFPRGVGLANGALVPSNGHARANGYGGGVCGQFLFESVEGHAFGDSRFLRVGPEQDADATLDAVVPRFEPW